MCSLEVPSTNSYPKIHNEDQTRALLDGIIDPQLANIADYDCFSQVVFRDVNDYKRFKQDPYYKAHLWNDHENFANTARTR